MKLAARKRTSPSFSLPGERGSITVNQVMAAPAGCERDKAIDEWCASVWSAFQVERQSVVQVLLQHGGIV